MASLLLAFPRATGLLHIVSVTNSLDSHCVPSGGCRPALCLALCHLLFTNIVFPFPLCHSTRRGWDSNPRWTNAHNGFQVLRRSCYPVRLVLFSVVLSRVSCYLVRLVPSCVFTFWLLVGYRPKRDSLVAAPRISLVCSSLSYCLHTPLWCPCPLPGCSSTWSAQPRCPRSVSWKSP